MPTVIEFKGVPLVGSYITDSTLSPPNLYRVATGSLPRTCHTDASNRSQLCVSVSGFTSVPYSEGATANTGRFTDTPLNKSWGTDLALKVQFESPCGHDLVLWCDLKAGTAFTMPVFSRPSVELYARNGYAREKATASEDQRLNTVHAFATMQINGLGGFTEDTTWTVQTEGDADVNVVPFASAVTVYGAPSASPTTLTFFDKSGSAFGATVFTGSAKREPIPNGTVTMQTDANAVVIQHIVI